MEELLHYLLLEGNSLKDLSPLVYQLIDHVEVLEADSLVHLGPVLVLHLLLLMSQLGVFREHLRYVLKKELLGRYRLSRHRDASLGLDHKLLLHSQNVLLHGKVLANLVRGGFREELRLLGVERSLVVHAWHHHHGCLGHHLCYLVILFM